MDATARSCGFEVPCRPSAFPKIVVMNLLGHAKFPPYSRRSRSKQISRLRNCTPTWSNEVQFIDNFQYIFRIRVILLTSQSDNVSEFRSVWILAIGYFDLIRSASRVWRTKPNYDLSHQRLTRKLAPSTLIRIWSPSNFTLREKLNTNSVNHSWHVGLK